MMAPDFWEVGASGRCCERAFVLEVLEHRRGERESHAWRTSDFACRELGPSTWLLTYALDQGGRVTRRATIWRHASQGWVAPYRQGTLVADD
ncbi:hypothetical protein HF690_03945 [Oleiagrimonas citrea]|uniref:DUF4440 domain-containing protein n=1 Tax=Oleiagrimonas citrea TaxID=1665687 RepID=A0A846ZIS2_9GAMM|nr:hypothetical protein [Oleiagrimonas citrea]